MVPHHALLQGRSMTYRILVTGSEGLVGKGLCRALARPGVTVEGLDLAALGRERGDVRDAGRVRSAAAECEGIVHLAAVSRVVWGEQDPDRCWETNVGGLRHVLDAAESSPRRPWLLFASSREVYGQSERLPATEDAPLRPINTYGRAKVEGERMVQAARDRGLCVAIVRLSNVYGRTDDHPDRVIPSFAKAAVTGGLLRVDGRDNTFDFTHLEDTVRGILAICERLASGGRALPPIHLLTGRPTSLGRLGDLVVRLSGGRAEVRCAEPRSYDVSRFYGSPDRARELLGWSARIGIEQGVARLIEAFRQEALIPP